MKTVHPSRTRRQCLVALACAAAAWPSPGATAAQRLPWPRQRATPALQLPHLDGTLAAWRLGDARGQAVLLNFWASWCEPCRAEMPALQALAAMHRAAGLQVLTVNFRESEAVIQRFVASLPLDLPILRDADGAAARAFGVRIFPTTVAVARHGRAVFSVVGETDWTQAPARDWVAALL